MLLRAFRLIRGFLRQPVRLDALLSVVVLSGGFLFLRPHRIFREADADVSRPGIGVSDLVQKLRSDLEKLETERASQDQAAIIRVKDIDLEVNFVVRAGQTDKSEIHLEAVTVGGENSASLERSDKITLHMEVEPPNWAYVVPEHLSIDSRTKELPAVPLERKSQ